jgi:hypothetical protein
MKKYLLLLALVSLMFGITVWQAQGQATASSETRSPTLDWDSRLDGLNVTYQPAADCSAGCWRLESAQYEDESESGGNHNIYGRMRDENGTLLVNATWYVAWPDGTSPPIYTKPEPDWSDFPINACYYPDQGQAGGYRAYAGNNETQSDKVSGMGLPYCWHVNFKLIWQWQPAGAEPTQTATQVPTETATETPLPDSTPTITATPNTNLIARLWLPLVLRQEAAVAPSPTATATAASSEATATATATAEGMPFGGEIVQTLTNCGLTQVFGVVHDAAGQPLPGTRVRLTWDNGKTYYATAGDYDRPETDASGWDFVLANGMVPNTWRVAIVDEAGNLLSKDVEVQTDGHCNGDTVNVAKVRFSESTSPPTATATAAASSPTATAASSPTATATPGGMPFGGEIVETFVNCGLTQVFGVVHDAAGQPLPGTRVRLTWDNGKTYTATAGDYIRPETDDSGWEFTLNTALVANTWRVAIVDQAGTLLSEEVYVQTDSHCNSGAVNVAKVRFMGTQ